MKFTLQKNLNKAIRKEKKQALRELFLIITIYGIKWTLNNLFYKKICCYPFSEKNIKLLLSIYQSLKNSKQLYIFSKVVLEALKERETLEHLANKYEFAPTQTSLWKEEAIGKIPFITWICPSRDNNSPKMMNWSSLFWFLKFF